MEVGNYTVDEIVDMLLFGDKIKKKIKISYKEQVMKKLIVNGSFSSFNDGKEIINKNNIIKTIEDPMDMSYTIIYWGKELI